MGYENTLKKNPRGKNGGIKVAGERGVIVVPVQKDRPPCDCCSGSSPRCTLSLSLTRRYIKAIFHWVGGGGVGMMVGGWGAALAFYDATKG